MYIEYAAHVDHGIGHTASAAQISLGITFAAVAVVFCSSGAGTMACIGGAATAGGVGMDIGKIVDNFSAPSIDEKLKSGIDSVFLGRAIKNAARAHDDSRGDTHDKRVAEGSILVMLGKEIRPMSRRQDRLLCGGQIAEGNETILVGGEPSQKGQEISEEDSMAVRIMSAVFGIGAGLKDLADPSNLTKLKGAADLGSTALEAAGFSDAASVTKAATAGGFPSGGTLMEKMDWVSTGVKGVQGGTNLGTSLVSP